MSDLPPSGVPRDETPDQNDAVEYVGAPTEFADAEEVPTWVANLVKAIVFIPSLFAVLSAVELVLLVVGLLLACGFLAMVGVLTHIF